MPNHVKQVLEISGPDAAERMDAYFTDFDVVDTLTQKREQWRGFDFGKIIARPANWGTDQQDVDSLDQFAAAVAEAHAKLRAAEGEPE